MNLDLNWRVVALAAIVVVPLSVLVYAGKLTVPAEAVSKAADLLLMAGGAVLYSLDPRRNKAVPTTPVVPALILVAALAISGCALLTPKNVDHAEEGARVACVLANAYLSESTILKICALAPDFLDFVRKVVGEHKAGVRRELEKAGVKRPVASYQPTSECRMDGYRSAYGLEPGL
jgi:hypothetical protein